MNCKDVQELLPLYVGRDLEESNARLVTSHVQACSECANSASQYRESRLLLQQFAPPRFSDSTYAGIRQRVLDEIAQESSAPTLLQLIASPLNPGFRWAFATVLLLSVCLLAFYISSIRNEQIAPTPQAVEGTSRGEQANAELENPRSRVLPVTSGHPGDGAPLMSAGGKGVRNPVTKPARAKLPEPLQQTRKSLLAGFKSDVVNRRYTRSLRAETSPTGSTIAPDVLPIRDPESSQKILRMEIQTKDQNIRIIWFSHQPTGQDASRESSKGI
jgi:hypothetical protein